jgi:hypothetical protein
MRGVAVLALGLVALVACTSSTAGATGTSLRVSYWEGGSTADKPDAVWTIRCHPPRGTLAQPVRACSKLVAGGAKLFAGTPPDTACTEIYGGPERARIVGVVRGKRVWVTVTRSNGCEITRWERLSPWLIPRGGVT